MTTITTSMLITFLLLASIIGLIGYMVLSASRRRENEYKQMREEDEHTDY
jgi:preprotein translocase subunit YajC